MSLMDDVRHELLVQREWEEYAEACLTHDPDEPAVTHAAELVADQASYWGTPNWRNEPNWPGGPSLTQ